jgi:hypothetical protein
LHSDGKPARWRSPLRACHGLHRHFDLLSDNPRSLRKKRGICASRTRLRAKKTETSNSPLLKIVALLPSMILRIMAAPRNGLPTLRQQVQKPFPEWGWLGAIGNRRVRQSSLRSQHGRSLL